MWRSKWLEFARYGEKPRQLDLCEFQNRLVNIETNKRTKLCWKWVFASWFSDYTYHGNIAEKWNSIILKRKIKKMSSSKRSQWKSGRYLGIWGLEGLTDLTSREVVKDLDTEGWRPLKVAKENEEAPGAPGFSYNRSFIFLFIYFGIVRHSSSVALKLQRTHFANQGSLTLTEIHLLSLSPKCWD